MRLRGLWLGLLLTACAPPLSPLTSEIVPDEAIPAGVIAIAETDQIEPPALAFSGGELTIFTIGSDDLGIHHDVRTWSEARGLSPVTILPLPPRHPFHQRAYPGLGASHLLWIDADPAAPDNNRLYGAVISSDQGVLRGPTAISAADQHVSTFDAVPRADGGLIAVYQGGGRGESDLYLTEIDASGVPRPAQRIASNSDGLALTGRADDGWLFWHAAATGQIMRLQIRVGGLSAPIDTAAMIYIGPADRLIAMNASIWGDQAGLIVTIARADGSSEAWQLCGELTAPFWPAPQRLITEQGAPITQAVFVPGTARFIGLADGQLSLWEMTDGPPRLLGSGVAAQMVRPPNVVATSDGQAFAAWSDIRSSMIGQRLTHFFNPSTR